MSEEEKSFEKSIQLWKDRLKGLEGDLHFHVIKAYHTQENMDECKERIKKEEIALDSLFPNDLL